MSYIFGFATYTLVVHADIAGGCFSALATLGRPRGTLSCEHSEPISAAVVVAGISVFPIPDIRTVAIRIHVGPAAAADRSLGARRPADYREQCESSDNGLHDISPCLSDDRRRSLQRTRADGSCFAVSWDIGLAL